MKKLKDIFDILPEDEHCKKYFDPISKMFIYEVCGRKFQETASVEYVLECLKKIYDTYGQRAIDARNNKNIDTKALSHAVRAALEVKELLIDKTITFPLKEASLVKKIKEARMDYTTEVVPILEDLIEEVTELSEKSTFPEKIDREFWDDFIIKVVSGSSANAFID